MIWYYFGTVARSCWNEESNKEDKSRGGDDWSDKTETVTVFAYDRMAIPTPPGHKQGMTGMYLVIECPANVKIWAGPGTYERILFISIWIYYYYFKI